MVDMSPPLHCHLPPSLSYLSSSPFLFPFFVCLLNITFTSPPPPPLLTLSSDKNGLSFYSIISKRSSDPVIFSSGGEKDEGYGVGIMKAVIIKGTAQGRRERGREYSEIWQRGEGEIIEKRRKELGREGRSEYS